MKIKSELVQFMYLQNKPVEKLPSIGSKISAGSIFATVTIEKSLIDNVDMGEVTCALEELNKTISKILINATPKGKELVFSE